MSHDAPADPEIDAIYEALEQQDAERALELARRALAQRAGDPAIRLLAGLALLDLDRPDEAVGELEAGAEDDPADADLAAHLALALFRCCRFPAASRAAARALRLDRDCPEAHYVRGMLEERAGRQDEAERCFARAARLDPQRFPQPLRLSREAFDEQVRRAIDRLPDTWRRHLGEVAISVEDVPAESILLEDEPALDPENLLGLFVGVSRDRRSHFSAGGELPPRILLFRRNLERLALDPAELTREIALTLYHELGHYLGLDEDQVTDPEFESGARRLSDGEG
jgi:predicted Zn-dependent protease with MMP-like domain